MHPYLDSYTDSYTYYTPIDVYKIHFANTWYLNLVETPVVSEKSHPFFQAKRERNVLSLG